MHHRIKGGHILSPESGDQYIALRPAILRDAMGCREGNGPALGVTAGREFPLYPARRKNETLNGL